MKDRRKVKERRSFATCKPLMEWRKTIIKNGRRVGKEERRSLNRCPGSLCWYVKNLREVDK